MKKLKYLFLGLGVILSIAFIASLFDTEVWGIELRTKNLVSWSEGKIQSLLISAASLFLLFYAIIEKIKKYVITFSFFLITFVALFFILNTFNFRIHMPYDEIVYCEKTNKNEKLIFQQYRNLNSIKRWRAITTNDITDSIRNIKLQNYAVLKNHIGRPYHSVKLDKISHEITLENKTYELETVALSNNSIKHFQ